MGTVPDYTQKFRQKVGLPVAGNERTRKMQFSKPGKIRKSIFVSAIALIVIVDILLVIAYGILFMPVKYAVKYSDLDKNEDYVTVRETPAGSNIFELIEDKSDKYDYLMEVRITGSIPGEKFENYGIMMGGPHSTKNEFVLYGESMGVKNSDMGKYLEYDVNHWDILYPVKRENAFGFLFPKRGICRADYSNFVW
jgi:hypothetical protein